MASLKRILPVLFLVLLISVVIFLASFPSEPSRIFMNQRRAVKSIQDLNRAEQSYRAQHRDTGFACNLGDLGALVDGVLASGTRSGYNFEIGCPQSGNQQATTYTITAVPTKPGTTGVDALCTDQRGEIWYSENGLTSDCLAMRKPIAQKYR